MKLITKYITLFLIFFTTQANSQCWNTISSGLFHAMGIKSDGTLWAWGKNDTGQLGDGTLIQKYIPTQIGTSNNWKIVSCGEDFTVGIQTDGTLWSWGNNVRGQLGNGNFTNSITPTQVGTDNTWDTLDCGYSFCVALKGNFSKTLWTWGYNEFGQLGDGNNVNVNVPQQIGVSTSWKSVSAGAYHTLALEFVTGGSRLMGWGLNQFGQLGDNTVNPKNIPTQIGTDVNWQTVVTGYFHSLAKKTTGTLWAWGYNGDYQLGSGNTIDIHFPTQITTDTNWQGVLSAGFYHSMIKKTDGTLWTWGRNTYGELGSASLVYTSIPKQMGTATNWGNIISASSGFSLALRQDGTLNSWGSGFDGQLGNGSSALNASTPVSITCPTTLGINNSVLDNSSFKVFPNPTANFLNIETPIDTNEFNFKIIDMLGNVVLENNENSNNINIQNLSKGMYIIQLFIDDKNFQQKFIKN